METIRRRPNGRRTFSEDETKSNDVSSLPSFSYDHIVNEIPPEDLLMTPIVAANTDETKAMDDSFIRRLSLGVYADLEQKGSASASARTTPRRPAEGGKYCLYPSNTFVASNGEVYHVDPFQLPPPSGEFVCVLHTRGVYIVSLECLHCAEIAEVFQEINQRRVIGKRSPRNAVASAVTPTPSTSPPSIAASKKYPSLPSEWMRTPRTSLQESKKQRALSPEKSPCSAAGDRKSPEEEEEEDDEPFNFKIFSWRKFLLAEMLGIGQPAAPVEPIVAESIDNFLSVPYKLECLVIFGCFVALDSFLYVITYMPIRFCFAVYVFVDEVALPTQLKMASDEAPEPGVRSWNFPRNRLYDFMRGLLLLTGCYALSLVDMSRVYHYIRMQNTLKLYALTGMMEIVDKLLCSFGIDVLESLFVKSRSSGQGSGAVFTFVVAAVYVVIHSSLYFLHLATLTVAINNQDQSLVTVLILNNFAEIKTSVLKKFDCGNLFQLACSDISERFKMFLFYTLIIFVGLSQARDVIESFWLFANILLAMVCCEMAVDWIKHAFIAKFNSIKSTCYIEFSRTLRNDILNGHNDKITLDHSYTITKRLGMSQIPLGVVFFKFFSIAMSSSRMTALVSSMSAGQVLCCCLVVFGLVLMFKVALAVGLIYYTAYMNSKEREQERAEELEARRRLRHQGGVGGDEGLTGAEDDRKKSVEALSNIELYTMLQGRINS